MRLGLPPALLDMHPGWIEVKVEVKIDVNIEAVGKVEDTRDLTARIVVGVRTSTDQVRSFFASLGQQFVRALMVQQSFLGKHANLQIDRPGKIMFQPLDGAEAAQADARVDLNMSAHMHRALQNHLIQNEASANIYIFFFVV